MQTFDYYSKDELMGAKPVSAKNQTGRNDMRAFDSNNRNPSKSRHGILNQLTSESNRSRRGRFCRTSDGYRQHRIELRPALCDRSVACFRLTGFLARFDALHMQRAPFAEGFQRRIKRVAERRK